MTKSDPFLRLRRSLEQTAEDLRLYVETFEKASELEHEALQSVRQATARAARRRDPAARRAAVVASDRLRLIGDIRRQASLERRAAKVLYREQIRLSEAVDNREREREKAVSDFVERWERDYDHGLAERQHKVERLRRCLNG